MQQVEMILLWLKLFALRDKGMRVFFAPISGQCGHSVVCWREAVCLKSQVCSMPGFFQRGQLQLVEQSTSHSALNYYIWTHPNDGGKRIDFDNSIVSSKNVNVQCDLRKIIFYYLRSTVKDNLCVLQF
jgi:hypothetical protein